MQNRREIARQVLVLVAVFAVPLAIVTALSADSHSDVTTAAADPRPAEREPTRKKLTNPKTQSDRIIVQLQNEEDGGSSSAEVDVDPADEARCKEPDSSSRGEDLPNARLFVRDYAGEEPRRSGVNRATGCFFETGRKTEFGFSSTIEGQSFGQALGAGDFVAFVMEMWVASEGSDDGFALWNMRTGQSLFDQPACNDRVYGQDECFVSDIELTDSGSAAFSACEGGSATEAMSCRVYLVPDGATKRYRLGRIVRKDGISPTLLNKDGRLYWLDGKDKLQSAPFD